MIHAKRKPTTASKPIAYRPDFARYDRDVARWKEQNPTVEPHTQQFKTAMRSIASACGI